MLLLEPGEIFFEDYSVHMKLLNSSSSQTATDNTSPWVDGRLKLCSKSLVFVDKDINRPLIKVQLKEAVAVEKCIVKDSPTGLCDILSVQSNQYVEMLERNILAPYKFVHKSMRFLFCFNYATVDDCLSQILQLLRAASLPTAEQNAMITAIVHSRQSRVSFDTSWLEDLYEQIIFETPANKISPLVVNPGRVLLTTCRIYFQPYNNMGQHPVLKINLRDIKHIIKRRFLLRQIGLEIKWTRKTDNKSEHLYLSLKSPEDRDKLYSKLLSQPETSLDQMEQNQLTIQWQNGCLSNYEYLLYINSLADRTFYDLTQYPVMPWVLQNYHSKTLDFNDTSIYRDLTKPIGALEPRRLQRLKDRYMEMSEPKFLYGSHYSAPGFVLFYLVRKYPQYMLCLQSGRFDHPDRMFNSVPDVWKNVLENMSDFKELIPEFYDTSNSGDFLVNSYGIDFGYRHDGTKIGDVQLPPWADGPSDFIEKLRSALESDWVSENLHHWIDLIFGYKQRGVEAEKANNVFVHLCYEGSVDLDTILDINDRHAMEVQIMEFGQVPKQIFTVPHPKRLICNKDRIFCDTPLSSVRTASVSEETTSEPHRLRTKEIALNKKTVFQSHKETVSSITFTNGTSDDVVSVGQDGVLKMHSVKHGKLTRSITLSQLPLSSCISYSTGSQNTLVVGSWDNTLIFYDVEFGRVTATLRGHEDAISCLAWSQLHNVIVSGSWDCTVKVWKSYVSGTKIKLSECLVAQLDHDAKVTCIDLSRDESMLATGTDDGEVLIWNMKGYHLQFTAKAHTDKVNAVTFDSESKTFISCSSDQVFNVMDVQTTTQIYRTVLQNEPTTFNWIDSFLLIGDTSGDISIWSLQGAEFVSKFHCHDGTVTAIATSKDNNNIIITGGKDKKVILWTCGGD